MERFFNVRKIYVERNRQYEKKAAYTIIPMALAAAEETETAMFLRRPEPGWEQLFIEADRNFTVLSAF